jgi:two-component sensor histidine kinase
MPEEELKTHHFLEFVHPEDREATLEAIDKMRTTLKPLHGVIKREQTPAGVRIIEWNRAPIIDDDGRFAGHQSTGRDITARKEAEERIERLLSEREFLLRHGQHRIKNDMQFIRSLLGLQAERMDSEQPRQALREAAGRLDVMAKVYERLYTFDLGSEISSRSLATEIITELKKQHRVHGLTVRTDIEDIPLSAPLATASGMIVDELYTNSCKYAFTDHPDPSLDITVERERHSNTACEKLRISVQDNGPGYPPPVLRLEDAGFGTLMIRALVEQHQGTLTLENRDGAVTTVLIPLADPDVSPASA